MFTVQLNKESYLLRLSSYIRYKCAKYGGGMSFDDLNDESDIVSIHNPDVLSNCASLTLTLTRLVSLLP